MKTRTLKINEPVVYNGRITQVKGYHSDSEELYVIEVTKGWFGWCALQTNDIIDGHQIENDKRYNLAYERELKRANHKQVSRQEFRVAPTAA
ncbi:MAG: hypothetical protein IIA45_05090 [Bacteroidetes bacterium]|nr:hypothetical protein [Bacteroidota bacterium]